MPKPRGRPREFDDQTAKLAIMRAFWEKGYSATSLDYLAKKTGLVRPSLYLAYGSKLEMYLMALDVFLEQLAPVRVRLASAVTAEVALETFYLYMIGLYFGENDAARLGCFLVGTALVEAPKNDDIRIATANRLERLNGLIASALETKMPNAEAGKIDFAAQMAVATLHSIAVRTRAGEDKDRLIKFARSAARFIASSLTMKQEL